jgi:uncharacterized protein YjbJ (UPF0337 family)
MNACSGLQPGGTGQVRDMQMGTIDLDKLRGVGDKFVGLAKETVGVLIDNDGLQRAGEAQQTKATETLKALRDEAKAEAKEAKAAAIGRANPGSGGSGVIAEAKGRAKQAVGAIAGNSRLEKEGQADEERGASERGATQDRISAKAHEAKAKGAEKAEDAASSTD